MARAAARVGAALGAQHLAELWLAGNLQNSSGTKSFDESPAVATPQLLKAHPPVTDRAMAGPGALQDAAARPSDDASPTTASTRQADLQDLSTTDQATFDSPLGAAPADASGCRSFVSAFNSRCQANYCGNSKVGFSPNGPPHGGTGKARSLAAQASNPAAHIQLAALTVSAGAGEQTIPIDWTGG